MKVFDFYHVDVPKEEEDETGCENYESYLKLVSKIEDYHDKSRKQQKEFTTDLEHLIKMEKRITSSIEKNITFIQQMFAEEDVKNKELVEKVQRMQDESNFSDEKASHEQLVNEFENINDESIFGTRLNDEITGFMNFFKLLAILNDMLVENNKKFDVRRVFLLEFAYLYEFYKKYFVGIFPEYLKSIPLLVLRFSNEKSKTFETLESFISFNNYKFIIWENYDDSSNKFNFSVEDFENLRENRVKEVINDSSPVLHSFADIDRSVFMKLRNFSLIFVNLDRDKKFMTKYLLFFFNKVNKENYFLLSKQKVAEEKEENFNKIFEKMLVEKNKGINELSKSIDKITKTEADLQTKEMKLMEITAENDELLIKLEGFYKSLA